jgi:ferritin-like metal-binding protein YciE
MNGFRFDINITYSRHALMFAQGNIASKLPVPRYLCYLHRPRCGRILHGATQHSMKPLEKVFWDEVAEMLHLEGMLSKSLLKMHSAVQSEDLKQFLTSYRLVADTNAANIGETLRLFELPMREKKNDCAMAMLLKVQQSIQRSGSGAALDAVLLSLLRKVIVHKIVSYSTLRAWAKVLSDGQHDPVSTFETLASAEMDFERQIGALVATAYSAAAEQKTEIPRAAVKRPKEAAGAELRGGW